MMDKRTSQERSPSERDPDPVNSPSFRAGRWSVPVLLGLSVLACFWPTFSNEFVNWDDDANFLENFRYRGLSWTHLRWMFTTFHMGNYQPLTWLTLGLDYELWGMNAGGYHFTNLVLHIASTILFYLFLQELVNRIWPTAPDVRPAARWPAAIGALFFAVHPLRVESVAWATGRKDVLCGFFVMLTLIAYLRMERDVRVGRPGLRWLLVSVLMFVCSLLSKALGIMLPVVLLAFDIYPLRRFGAGQRRRVLLEKVPYLAASAIEGLLTLHAIGEAGLSRPLQGISLLGRAEEAAYGLCFYLYKTALPLGLSPLYPAPRVFDPRTVVLWASVLGAVVLTCALVMVRRRFPAGLAAWFSYSTLLLPVLRLNYDSPHIVADRYTYLSCLPLEVMIAFLLARTDRDASPQAPLPLFKRPAFLIAGGMLLALGSLTFMQTLVWRNSISLWSQALKVDPANTYAYNNRGIARALHSDRKGAIEDFDQAIRLDPDFSEAYHNRGSLRMDSGDLEGAIADETEAIRASPGYGRAYRTRAMARKARGDAEGARADFAEASRIEAALISSKAPPGGDAGSAVDPHALDVQALNNEGNARASKGDFDGAIAQYTRALEIDPKMAAVYNNRGNARASKQDQVGAIADYSDALKLDPAFSEAYANRGLSRALQGDLKGAVDDYSEALRISPRDPTVLANRGIARAKLRDRAGAIEDFERALLLAPPDWPRRPDVQTLLRRLGGR
jgi:tetratricopeptide (TPR) repeat protein